MCPECSKVITSNPAMFDEYRNGSFFRDTSTADSHLTWNGIKLCRKWWEEKVDAVR